MRESERLCAKGIAQLQQAGWPQEAIEEIVTTLMGAGMAFKIEQMIDEAQRNEALIQKVGAN
jgi:lipase chaperone LimK